jgi:hypothetical protein
MKNFFFNYYVFDYTFKNAFILYANLFLVDRVLFPSGITKIFFFESLIVVCFWQIILENISQNFLEKKKNSNK